MYLTGFADEASQDLEVQIRTTKELGWTAIEARGIWGTNIHDLDDERFELVCRALRCGVGEIAIELCGFGSECKSRGACMALQALRPRREYPVLP